MNPSRKISSLLALVLILMPELPAVAGNSDHNLFKIGRSRDADEIYYDVRLAADGRLDRTSPVDIYWVRKTGAGSREPLTWIQRRYSYGIKIIESSPDHALFRFVSFNSKVFRIEKGTDGRFSTRTHIGDKQVTVENIFVRFDGGTYLAPVVGEVFMYGRDTLSKILISEDIKP